MSEIDDNESKSQEESQKQNENDVVDIEDDQSKKFQKAEKQRYKEKEHFYSLNLQEERETVAQRAYPKNKLLDEIYENYQKILRFKPSQDEILLKIEDAQYLKQQKITVSEMQALKKERDKIFYKYLLGVRKNFVNEELFGKLKKRKQLTHQDFVDQKDSEKNSDDEAEKQKDSDVEDEDFSNYSEFY